MQTITGVKKMIISHFDDDGKLFYLKSEGESEDVFTVAYNIKLQATVNGVLRSVNTELPSETYSIQRFTNPYLKAENDLFKIRYADRSVGFIIPNSALEDNIEKSDEDFDEYLQAYKFYCAKSIIEQFDFNNSSEKETLIFSDLIDINSIYAIVCNPIINEDGFNLENCLPSLAIRGYYFFPENTIPNVLSFVDIQSDDLNALIEAKYLKIRDEKSIRIQKSLLEIDQVQLLKLLYKNTLRI